MDGRHQSSTSSREDSWQGFDLLESSFLSRTIKVSNVCAVVLFSSRKGEEQA